MKRTDSIVFDRDTDGQEQRLARERAQELQNKKRGLAGGFLAGWKLNAKEDLVGLATRLGCSEAPI